MSSQPISIRQVVALIHAKVDAQVRHGRILRLAQELAKRGMLRAEAIEQDAYTPDDYDRVAGEIHRQRAGWYQGRNVRGDFWAWVERGDGTRALLLLPYAREFIAAEQRESTYEPDVLDCWEWPTAVHSGKLVRVAKSDGYPVYTWQAVEPRRSREALADNL